MASKTFEQWRDQQGFPVTSTQEPMFRQCWNDAQAAKHVPSVSQRVPPRAIVALDLMPWALVEAQLQIDGGMWPSQNQGVLQVASILAFAAARIFLAEAESYNV